MVSDSSATLAPLRDIGSIDTATPATPEIINANVAIGDTPASNDGPAADRLLIATNTGINIPATSVLEPGPEIVKPLITEISHQSLIPSMCLVAGGVAAREIRLGVVSSNFLGQLGAVIGTVLDGIVGDLAVVISHFGVPV